MSRSAPKSNVALLTEGQSYIQRAKKAREEQIDSIKFDDTARSEWLTGFSKRKKAKHDERKARAVARDHQEHLDERKKARSELKERARQNVRSVRTAMGLENSDSESGDEDSDDGNAIAGPSKPRQEDVEFEDEDQVATVTITDDFDPSLPNDRRRAPDSSDEDELKEEAGVEEKKPKVKLPAIPASSKRAAQKAKREKEEKKRSKSMETKSERKMGKAMEAKRRTKKAGMAIERDGKRSNGKKVGGKGKRGGKR